METLGFFYQKGKKDALTHHHELPHGLVDSIWTWSKAEVRRKEEENKAYDKGYYFMRGLDDAKSEFYGPPETDNQKAAYDQGYQKEIKLHEQLSH